MAVHSAERENNQLQKLKTRQLRRVSPFHQQTLQNQKYISLSQHPRFNEAKQELCCGPVYILCNSVF